MKNFFISYNAADRGLAVQAVRHWLEHQRDWLLIFDNGGEPTGCRDYLPRANTGHVLVTSRNPNWRGVAEPLPVKVLPRQEAIAFLTKRTGQDHPQAANDLCEAVADLPLALEQAGAYIDATGIAIAEYLARFRMSAKRLRETRSPSAEYPDPVWTTRKARLASAAISRGTPGTTRSISCGALRLRRSSSNTGDGTNRCPSEWPGATSPTSASRNESRFMTPATRSMPPPVSTGQSGSLRV